MSLTMSFGESESIVRVPLSMHLAELSFGLQQIVEWNLGRGVTKWKLERRRDRGEMVVTVSNHGVEPKRLSYSTPEPFIGLVKAGFMPLDVQERWLPGKNEKTFELVDGNSRINRIFRNKGESILVMEDINPETDISDFCYGQGDIMIELFMRGSTKIQTQVSLAVLQMRVNMGMSESELANFWESTYNLDQLVSAIRD